MTALTIIIPTVGRPELANCLTALAAQTQDGDRVMVMCDVMAAYDSVVEMVAAAAMGRDTAAGTWRAYPPLTGQLGCYGHPQRNRALDLLDELERPPMWAWSIDDDDEPAFGALDMIRAALVEGGDWFVFAMRGGEGSHFPGVVVPTAGPIITPGNVGTPMIVFPLCDCRYGTSSDSAIVGDPSPPRPGYFGDYELARDLRERFGDPVWRTEIVAEIRPAR